MTRFRLKDFWYGRRTWIGLAMTETAAATAIALMLQLLRISMTTDKSATTGGSSELSNYVAFVFPLCIIAGVSSLLAAVPQAVEQRSDWLVIWQRIGMSSSDIVFTLAAQAALLGLATGIVGTAVAELMVRPFMTWLTSQGLAGQASAADLANPAITAISAVGATMLIAGMSAWMATAKHLRRSAARFRRRAWRGIPLGRLTVAALSALLIISCLRTRTDDLGSITSVSMLLSLGVCGFLLAAGPLSIRPAISLLARCAPRRVAPEWRLAASALRSRESRMFAPATPCVLAVTLMVGISSLQQATLDAASTGASSNAATRGGGSQTLAILGVPLALLLVSSCGALITSTDVRLHEVKQWRVMGATGRQTSVLCLLEGVILSLSSGMISLIPVAAGVWCACIRIKTLTGNVVVAVAWSQLGAIQVVLLLLISGSSLLAASRLPMVSR